MKKMIIAVMSVFTFLVPTSFADSWRCGSNIVSTGDTKGIVIAKCGNPLSIDKISNNKERQNNEQGFNQTETTIEELTYSANEGRVFYILTLENSRLVKIQSKFK